MLKYQLPHHRSRRHRQHAIRALKTPSHKAIPFGDGLLLFEVVLYLSTSSEDATFQEHVLKHIPSTFEYKFGYLNIIRTFEYNSKFKYKHSNLRLKHYLHYKVGWKGTNKSYKTCYFGLRIPYMQSFL